MMDRNFTYTKYADTEDESGILLVQYLKKARSKLTPVVDDIVMKAFDKINKGEKKFISPYNLTLGQYNDIIWATQVFQDVECGHRVKNRKYVLPNSEVIVNNVSVSKPMSAQDKSIIIDEATVLELLQLYENMGIVIQKMVKEGEKATEAPAPPTVARTTRAQSPTSTLSALLDTSSDANIKRESAAKPSNAEKRVTHKAPDEEPTVYIKIQCFSDWSDEDKSTHGKEIKCAKSCPSAYHVKLDGDPVTLKINQSADDGAVYCVNAGKEGTDGDIRIVIRQCPECKSTVIGSTTKLEGPLGDSHESITLHGKQGDEDRMAFSSSEDGSICRCLGTSKICISISNARCKNTSSCSCDKVMLDVTINTDSVDRSTVGVRDSTSDNEPKSKATIKPDKKLPLTRRRICSSMEFDVSQAQTRLRDHEMENNNGRIVVELKSLGVDQLLRACRPARCCRKAILNERQRTALPYCVSLRSLPLKDEDMEVIKQSIDMSVKKIKNSMDLTQVQKDTLAYYVSLGRDDFRPNINFPWVIPVFDMNLDPHKVDEDRLFVLKKRTLPKQVGSAAKLTRILKTDFKYKILTKCQEYVPTQRHFILMRATGVTSKKSGIKVTKSTIRKRNEFKKVRFKIQNDLKGETCYKKTLKCHQKKGIYKRKNIWTNIGHDDWGFIFTEEHKQLGLNCADFRFGETKVSGRHFYKKPTLSGQEHYEKLSHLSCSKGSVDFVYDKVTKISSAGKLLDGGDCASSSLSKIFEDYFGRKNVSKKKRRDLISSKSMPNFWSSSEELYYSSKALTVFLQQSRSLEKIGTEMQMFEIAQLEEERWKFIRSQFCNNKNTPKKLEYYVDLINGDLVWSSSFPLEPQNYNTYFNYSNSGVRPVQERVNQTRVTGLEASRMRSLSVTRNARASPGRPRRNPTGEQKRKPMALNLRNGPKLPPEYASFPMGPESTDESWAPLVASETSITLIREEKVLKKETRKEESVAIPNKPKDVENILLQSITVSDASLPPIEESKASEGNDDVENMLNASKKTEVEKEPLASPLHSRSPPPVRKENEMPKPLHNEAPKPLHNEAPKPLHNETPKPLHNEAPLPKAKENEIFKTLGPIFYASPKNAKKESLAPHSTNETIKESEAPKKVEVVETTLTADKKVKKDPLVPHVGNQTSLSTKDENKNPKNDVKNVETVFMANKKTDDKKEPHPVNKTFPTPVEESEVPKKKHVGTTYQVNTASGRTNNKEVQISGSSWKTDAESASKRPKDITIAIKKAKGGKGIVVEGKAPKACTKEICEIYKNKNLVPDRPENQHKPKEADSTQHFTLTAEENIEIYINNQKIKVLNSKPKKPVKRPKKDQ